MMTGIVIDKVRVSCILAREFFIIKRVDFRVLKILSNLQNNIDIKNKYDKGLLIFKIIMIFDYIFTRNYY